MAHALSGLPSEPVLSRNDETIRAGKGVKEARTARAVALARREAFRMLPESIPAMVPGAAAALDAIVTAKAALADSRTNLGAAMGGMEECKGELDALMAETGDRCPLCSQKVDGAEAFLHVHSHAAEERHV